MSDRTATPRGSHAGDSTEKSSIVDRVQSRLADASREHRANADGAGPAPARGNRSQQRGPRRAQLRLVRVDPWSVMKTSFLLAVAFGVVTFVAVFMIWSVLGAAGVWDSINSTVASVVDGDESSTFDVTNYVGMGRVLGFTLLVSVIDVILLTAIATLGAFLYNMAAALLGGVEVTLAEDDHR